MGRVQDAMRRAAGEGSAADVPTEPIEVVAPQEPADAAVLAAEPFPTELPESANGLMADRTLERDRLPSGAFEAEADKADEAPLAGESAPSAGDSGEPAGDAGEPAGYLARLGARHPAKVVIDDAMLPASREQYRRMAAALHHAREATGVSVVMIASAVAGEGKSLTASNLAMTFSESYQRSVLLIDGDLRRPSLHRLFGVEPADGLSEALSSIDEPRITVIPISKRLTLLPAGRANPDPMAGLTSVRMRRLIAEAKESFDWVFIDTPPVGLLSDANLLAAMVDAAVLVIRADTTPYPLVQRAVDAIGRERILGTVLNQATETMGAAYEYYHYHYHYAPTAEPAKGA